MMKKHLFLLLIATMVLTLCSCSCRHKASETLAALPATCTETGLTEGQKCSKCGEILTPQEEIPALGHTYELDPEVDPSCTEVGATPGFHCPACGEVFVAQEEIPALGHTEQVDDAVEATCTETGLTEGRHCTVCGEILVKQEVVPAKGHAPHRVTAEEFPRAQLDVMQGAACTVCADVFPFLTDETAESAEIAEAEDGSRIITENNSVWNLTRVRAYDPAGNLIGAEILEGDSIVLAAVFDAEDAAIGYVEPLYEEDQVYAGKAMYDGEGTLRGFDRYTYNENGSVEKKASFNSDGTESSNVYYDYTENGEMIRTRTYYADGTQEFNLIVDVAPGVEYICADSSTWGVTPFEVGLKAENGDEPVYMGIVPRNPGKVTVEVVDYLTGETVQAVEAVLGETALFDSLPDGYYFVRISGEGYEAYESVVRLVHDSCCNLESSEIQVNLVNPSAVFEEPVKIRLVDENGKIRKRETVTIGVTRNNSGVFTGEALETDRSGYVCFISTSEDENSTSDIYRVAQFALRDGCVLGYLDENEQFVPVIMDGSPECIIQY